MIEKIFRKSQYTGDREYIKNPDLLNFPLGEDYVRDEKLNELVKGKTIAMVGPAPNLQGKGMGEFIDSHDLVFRVGDSPVGFMGQTGKEGDYGSRSDVLVHSFNDHDRPQLQKDLSWLRSMQYLIQSMARSRDPENSPDAKWVKMVGVPFYNIPEFHMKTIEGWGYLFDHLGSLPNTGFIAILMLLNYDIKYMYITGYTFYNMGKWSKAGPSYFDDWYDTEKYKKHGLNEAQRIHNPTHYIDHFRKILNVDKHRNKIRLDEYLTKNFLEK